MKLQNKELVRAIAIAMTGGTLVFGGAAFAGSIADADSKHNLGTTGTAAQATGAATTEVCVFCHTPHGADNTRSVPLWNKGLPTSAGYTTYDSLGTSSLDGETAPVGSVSIACLSCHDGTQAMDNMINAPGSGGYNAGGAAFGNNVAMAGAPIPMLGQDLSNDHPVGIQYAGGGYAVGGNEANHAGKGDADFNDLAFKVIGSTTVWWVDSTVDGIRSKDEMQMYTRAEALQANGSPMTVTVQQPFVECASCHDPHNKDSAITGEVQFLRMSNASSALCLACHVK